MFFNPLILANSGTKGSFWTGNGMAWDTSSPKMDECTKKCGKTATPSAKRYWSPMMFDMNVQPTMKTCESISCRLQSTYTWKREQVFWDPKNWSSCVVKRHSNPYILISRCQISLPLLLG